MKKLFILLILYANFSFAQRDYSNSTNQHIGNFGVEAGPFIGENNIGGGLMFGYYVSNYAQVRAGGVFRKFNYKSYSEDILEANADFVYTFYSPRYTDTFLHRFNTAALGGVAFEQVKVTSQTQLIDPYPKYLYFYLGGQLEFTASDHIGIIGNFRQYYALNGGKDKLGFWRYDYGLTIRYYFWGRR